MDDVATQAEIEWALTFAGTASPGDLARLERELAETGRVPDWCGPEVLCAWAHDVVAEQRLDDAGRSWLEVLDAIRAHADTPLARLPPVRTD